MKSRQVRIDQCCGYFLSYSFPYFQISFLILVTQLKVVLSGRHCVSTLTMEVGHHRGRHHSQQRHKQHDQEVLRESHERSNKRHRSHAHEEERLAVHTSPLLKDSPLNNAKAYIYQWLDRTEADHSKTTIPQDEPLQAFQSNHTLHKSHGHFKHVSNKNFGHQHQVGSRELCEDPIEGFKYISDRKRRRIESSDSSILDYPAKRISHSPREDVHVQISKHSSARERHTNKRLPGSDDHFPDSTGPQIRALKETFEKRARHKTREDRYDRKDDTKPRKRKKDTLDISKDKENKAKRVQKKPLKYSSARLMQNFTSQKLAKERLTVWHELVYILLYLLI